MFHSVLPYWPSVVNNRKMNWLDLFEPECYSSSPKQEAMLSSFVRAINQHLHGETLTQLGVLHHDGYHCPVMPQWNTTGVKWLWWTTRDYENSTSVKSSWNKFHHRHQQRIRCMWRLPTVCVCANVLVCDTFIKQIIQFSVCSEGPAEDRVPLAFACVESHGCVKVWGPLVHICAPSVVSRTAACFLTLGCSACLYLSWQAVRWILL